MVLPVGRFAGDAFGFELEAAGDGDEGLFETGGEVWKFPRVEARFWIDFQSRVPVLTHIAGGGA